MAISREERRAERAPRVAAAFGEKQAKAVLDLFELVEFAWHDCYSEVAPSEEIVNDILFCSDGDLAKLIEAARLALTDWRDLKVWATHLRAAVDDHG